jgi:CelD/BcsL family acetyltransferase involved in cellulose biosynthesis
MAELSAGMTRGVVTAFVTTSSGFDALREEWDQLLDNSNQGSYFLRWKWTRLWWEHFAPPGSRLVLVVCRAGDGSLIGVAPLYWRQHTICKVPCTRELLFIGTGIELKTSEYLDIITRAGDEQLVAEAIGRAIHGLKDWDRIWLYHVPEDSRALLPLIKVLDDRQAPAPCDRAMYIDTSAGWDAFKRGLGRSMRRNVEYYPRRLFKRYRCQFRRVLEEHDLESATDALLKLHRERWQAKGEIASLSGPTVELFLREAMREGLQSGKLRLWTLAIEGTIEAVLVGFLDKGVLHYFQKGFNPSYLDDELGNSLVALCVRDCCEDSSIAAFDFMGGGAAYKSMWARHSRHTVVAEVNRQNWRTAAFAATQRVKSGSVDLIRRITPIAVRDARRRRLHKRRLQGHLTRFSPVALFFSSGPMGSTLEVLTACASIT